MVLHLLLGWLAWIRGHLDWLDLLVDVVLDVHLGALCLLLRCWSHQLLAQAPDLSCGAHVTTILRSYRSARCRFLEAYAS